MTTKKNTSKGIVSWPEDERPRERLLSLGPQAMTDAELITILVRVGLKGISAVELGRQLLNRFGSLRGEDALIAQGAVDAVRPSLRSIVARALQTNATGLIAAHNHPSGAAEPSEADRLLTRDLLAASAPLGLRVLDHVIVAEEATYSFADSGLLDELGLAAGVR